MNEKLNDDAKQEHYRARKARNWRAFYNRHKDRLRDERQARKLSQPPHITEGNWKVIGLAENDTGSARVRWVEAARIDGDAPWRTVWRHRHEISSPLSDWLLSLSGEPTEVPLITSIDEQKAAGRLCRGVGESIGTDLNRFGCIGRRPVVWIEDGRLRFFRSEAELARALGTYHPNVVWFRILGKNVFEGMRRL